MQKGSKNIQERRATCVVEDAQSTVIHAHGDSHQPQPHDGGWKLDELKVERGHDPSKGSNDNENREGAKSAIIAGDAERAYREAMDEIDGENADEYVVEDAQDALWQQGAVLGEVVPEATERGVEANEVQMHEEEN